jgi:hypothetical protein
MPITSAPYTVRARQDESKEIVEYPALSIRAATALAEILKQTGHELVEIVKSSDQSTTSN